MNTKKIAYLSIFLALQVVLSQFFIQIDVIVNVRQYFTFIIMMMVAANFDLKTCLIYAAIEDLLSFALFPSGAFNIYWTLTTVVAILIYHLWLKKKVNIFTVFMAKLSVNVIVNMIMNSYGMYLFYDKSFMLVFQSQRVIKNLIMLPFEVLIFIVIYKYLRPVIKKYLKIQ